MKSSLWVIDKVMHTILYFSNTIWKRSLFWLYNDIVIVITGDDEAEITRLKNALADAFEVKDLGYLNYLNYIIGSINWGLLTL
jgi:hypothetical protein